ncbi:hypothetical protein ACULLL_10050 [Lysinibacillus irui]|uniref:hypothetical protein n=1 Tax=Lysinibacillus irui TaxID=2998077 RepID=UPI0040441C1D
MEVVDYELVLDLRDLMDFKRNLEMKISIDECIKGQCFLYGIEPALTKSVSISAELKESEKEFAKYILQSIQDYISRKKDYV